MLLKFHKENIFIKKETPTQMFSCEFCRIYENIYFEEQLRMAASDCSGNYCFLAKDIVAFFFVSVYRFPSQVLMKLLP